MRENIYVKGFIIVVPALILSACAANCQANVELSVPEVSIHEDIVFARYYNWPQAVLNMDIFTPFDGKKHPAVILVPGGAWLAAPKSAYYQLAMKLAENNFAVSCIEYRVTGAADYAEIIGDVKAAVRFLRANADSSA